MVNVCFIRTMFLAIIQRECKVFSRENINILEWPGNSPDINPTENLWIIFKRRLTKYHCATIG